MWIYLLLLIVVFIAFIALLIYITRLSRCFIRRHVKHALLSFVLSLIPALILLLGLFIDIVNAIVVDIHFIVILFLIKIVGLLLKKIFQKEISERIILGASVVITSIILIYGYHLACDVKETYYKVYTQKDIGVENFLIVQITDSHIGSTMNGIKFSEYMEKINELNPDIVVLTGDFVDDNTTYEDMQNASNGLGKLKTKYGVFFIYGNHDKGYYRNRLFNSTDLKNELEKNNVNILEDKIINIGDNIILIGRSDKENKNRASISELIKDLDKNKYIIDLNHQPNDYENETKAQVDLVLSGHTHGGQLFPLGEIGLLLRANDKIYGMEKRDNTTFIVSSGISDWKIKFKTGTISEYVVIDINSF